MSLTAFLLVLTAAFCHATWNFLIKRINGGPELLWMMAVFSLILYTPFVIAVIVIEKPHFGVVHWATIIGSALVHLSYLLILQRGYRSGDLSLVYPTARATGPFLATIFAVTWLDESLTTQTAAGGLAIVFGVFMLTGGFRRSTAHVRTSLLFGLATGFFIGLYTVVDAWAVATLAISPVLLQVGSAIGRTTLLYPVARRRWSVVGAHWAGHKWEILTVSLFSSLAYILVLYALKFTPVIYVAPLRELSVLLSVLAGALLLGEANLRGRLIWATLIVAGMFLLATG